jgi:DNA invertase Pin-like site-specific DNA recombinase
MRVGIYLRVSTAGQTVENQRIDLTRVAEQRGWSIVDEYVDHGVSGAKGRDKRPGFDRMCKDAAQGKLDVIAAWAIDRVGRSLSDVATFMSELTAQKVALYLHQQNVDGTSPAGRAMLGMAAVFAEFERAMLTDRIHAGIARARKHGTKSGKAIGRPLAPTRDVERRARELRAKGYGLVRIGRALGIGTGRCKRILATGANAPPAAN